MKRLLCLSLLIMACLRPALPAAEPYAADAPPPTLMERDYLFEVVRHLYRWYLDEADVERAAGQRDFTFWVRPLRVALDEGDHSQFAEILLPGVGVGVKVKKTDYEIPEMKLAVRSQGFKIVNVFRMDEGTTRPLEAATLTVPFADMRDHLFRTRMQAEFPDEALLMRLRLALRREMQAGQSAPIEGDQLVYLAPVSPVGNELWVFWETGRKLIRFSSDIDLANPAVWERETLGIKVYDIESNVVVSLEEAVGSNAFLTRDQVGRALFNCIVFGKRIVLKPLDAANPAPNRP